MNLSTYLLGFISSLGLIDAIGTGGVAWVSRVLPMAVPALTADGLGGLLLQQR